MSCHAWNVLPRMPKMSRHSQKMRRRKLREWARKNVDVGTFNPFIGKCMVVAKCMNRSPDLVVCLRRDLQCLRPEASLVLIYRPKVAGMQGRVDLAQPVNRTPDLWCGSTRH
ncbi:hypothetical protein TNCV_3462771 [Trichonephila clavipes]|nr:hypothetical protein TNCV_3462771 [Trichonephila clavipes]